MRKLVTGCALFSTIVGSSMAAYDVKDRFKLLEDKFKTEEMLRPIGHDFVIPLPDISVYANKNVMDFIDDVSEVGDQATDSAKETKASEVLTKYDKTEQTIRVSPKFAIPLPSFTAWGVKIVPDLRFGAQFGLNVGIRKEQISTAVLIKLLPQDTPAEVVEVVSKFEASDIADLITNSTSGSVLDYINANPGKFGTLTTEQQNAIKDVELPTDEELGTTVTATTLPDLPNIFVFSKLDIKAGFLFNFFKDDYFGYWNLYGLHRTDIQLQVNSDTLANNDEIIEADEENSQTFLMTDIKVGKTFMDEKFSLFALIEEIKISRMSDNIAKGGDINYKIDPLFRLHGDYSFKWHGFSVLPFVGVHKREGYGFGDGLYAGSDFGFHVWGDRIGVRLRAMADTEHFTFSPQIKLWLMQLEYSLKQPLSSTVDDVKVSTIHSINFRLFF